MEIMRVRRVRIEGRDITGKRASTILERLKELNAQFDMAWINYDIRTQPNSYEKMAIVTISTKGMSVFIELLIQGLDNTMEFMKELNFDNETGLDLSQLWRWMRGEQTESFGCIKEIDNV